ncbi:MAG: PD-(D/E)XK nuclease family protein [Alphaproteobacteria bacterium]|nr:PD-(D/E)XK nuclease family protein [Alphaproteobacteria bacterium]
MTLQESTYKLKVGFEDFYSLLSSTVKNDVSGDILIVPKSIVSHGLKDRLLKRGFVGLLPKIMTWQEILSESGGLLVGENWVDDNRHKNIFVILSIMEFVQKRDDTLTYSRAFSESELLKRWLDGNDRDGIEDFSTELENIISEYSVSYKSYNHDNKMNLLRDFLSWYEDNSSRFFYKEKSRRLSKLHNYFKNFSGSITGVLTLDNISFDRRELIRGISSNSKSCLILPYSFTEKLSADSPIDIDNQLRSFIEYTGDMVLEQEENLQSRFAKIFEGSIFDEGLKNRIVKNGDMEKVEELLTTKYDDMLNILSSNLNTDLLNGERPIIVTGCYEEASLLENHLSALNFSTNHEYPINGIESLSGIFIIQLYNFILEDFSISDLLGILHHPFLNEGENYKSMLSYFEREVCHKTRLTSLEDTIEVAKRWLELLPNDKELEFGEIEKTEIIKYATELLAYLKSLNEIIGSTRNKEKSYNKAELKSLFTNILSNIDTEEQDENLFFTNLFTFLEDLPKIDFKLTDFRIVLKYYIKGETHYRKIKDIRIVDISDINLYRDNYSKIYAYNMSEESWGKRQTHEQFPPLRPTRSTANFEYGCKNFLNLFSQSNTKKIVFLRSSYKNGEIQIEYNILRYFKEKLRLAGLSITSSSYEVNYTITNQENLTPDYINISSKNFPKELYVSHIESIIDSSETFYHKQILKLRETRTLTSKWDYGELGSLIHEAIENYIKQGDFDGDLESCLSSFKKHYELKSRGNLGQLSYAINSIKNAGTFLYNNLENLYNIKKSEEKLSGQLFGGVFSDVKTSAVVDLICYQEDKLKFIDFKSWNLSKKHYKIQLPIIYKLLEQSVSYESYAKNIESNIWYHMSSSRNSNIAKYDAFTMEKEYKSLDDDLSKKIEYNNGMYKLLFKRRSRDFLYSLFRYDSRGTYGTNLI